MSLVSEALKKAERDAAARDARAKGAPAPFDAPLQPYRARGGGRSRATLFAARLAIALLVIAIAAGWWWSARKAPVKGVEAESPEGFTVSTSPGRANGSAAATAEPAPQDRSAALPPQAPSDLGVEAAQTPASPSASEPSRPKPTRLPLPKTAPSLSPPSPSASEPPPSASAATAASHIAPAAPAKGVSQGSGDYLRSVEFADGSKLELGGIVYSEAAPFAYLNGRLVGVGEFVLGRRIDRIERDRVILSGEGGEIILRLKTR